MLQSAIMLKPDDDYGVIEDFTSVKRIEGGDAYEALKNNWGNISGINILFIK